MFNILLKSAVQNLHTSNKQRIENASIIGTSCQVVLLLPLSEKHLPYPARQATGNLGFFCLQWNSHVFIQVFWPGLSRSAKLDWNGIVGVTALEEFIVWVYKWNAAEHVDTMKLKK